MINTDSDNVMLPDDTKLFPKPMWVNHEISEVFGIHMRAISQEILKISILDVSLHVDHRIWYLTKLAI